MFCPSCGNEVLNSKFCSTCGKKISPDGDYSVNVEKPINRKKGQEFIDNLNTKTKKFLSVKRNLYFSLGLIFILLLMLNFSGVFESDKSKAKIVAETFLTAHWNIVTGSEKNGDKEVLSNLISPGDRGLYSFELSQLRKEALRNKLTNYDYEIQSASATGNSATIIYNISLLSSSGNTYDVQRLVQLRKVNGQWLIVQDR